MSFPPLLLLYNLCPALLAEVGWCNTAGFCKQTGLTRSPVQRGNTRGDIYAPTCNFLLFIQDDDSFIILYHHHAGTGTGWDQESSLVHHQLQCSNRRKFINGSGLAIRWHCCKDLHSRLSVAQTCFPLPSFHLGSFDSSFFGGWRQIEREFVPSTVCCDVQTCLVWSRRQFSFKKLTPSPYMCRVLVNKCNAIYGLEANLIWSVIKQQQHKRQWTEKALFGDVI